MEIPFYPPDEEDEVLSFAEYQQRSQSRAVYPDAGSRTNFAYPALGLCGESGEVAEKVKKLLRDEGGDMTIEARDAIKKELGDVLWYIAAMCRELDITMEDVARANLEKVDGRHSRGTLRGSGDDR
jgi:NTP pyrophosphatase (non-canonical NTP hydrolase)